MKNFYFRAGFLALIGVIGSGYAEAQFKLNGPARILADESVCVANSDGNGINSDAVRNVPRVNILIGLAKGASAESLDVESLSVVTTVGHVAVASIDADKLNDLAALKEVTSVELSEETEEEDMIHTRQAAQTGISTVHRNILGSTDSGTDAGLGKAFLGEGVITAVYDHGIDVNHLNFRTGENYETSRVKGVYVYNGATAGIPSQVCLTPEEIAAFTCDTITENHGSHTLGILAGSYNGPGYYGEVYAKNTAAGAPTDSLFYKSGVTVSGVIYRNKPVPYYGVAPASEIMVGCGRFTTDNYIAFGKVLRDYAKAQGKPAVYSLSLGNTAGPKDGSSLLNQAMEELGKDMIICFSSSNDGDKKGWITKHFTESDNVVRTFLTSPSDASSTINGSLKSGILSFWGSDDQPFKFTLFRYDCTTGERVDLVVLDGPTPQTVRLIPQHDFEGTTANINYQRSEAWEEAFGGYCSMTAGVDAKNNRYNVSLTFPSTHKLRTPEISDSIPSDNSSSNLALGVEIIGRDGQSVWANSRPSYVIFSKTHYYKSDNSNKSVSPDGFLDGDATNSVNDLSTGKNVFCVGSYTARSQSRILGPMYADRTSGKPTSYSLSYTLQDIASSSSYASDMYDGRTLPHVAMPGVSVISSNNYYYMTLTSTSTSSTKYPRANTAVATDADGRDHFWFRNSGTSMSTPAFAGVCALMLEANPDLKWDDIHDIIKKTCRQDEFTKAKPERFGYGKVDAYAAVKEALTSSGMPVYNVDDKVLFSYQDGNINIFVGDTESYTASVYNLNGIQVASVSGVGDLNISTSDLAKGIYVVKVRGEKFAKSGKIVVK